MYHLRIVYNLVEQFRPNKKVHHKKLHQGLIGEEVNEMDFRNFLIDVEVLYKTFNSWNEKLMILLVKVMLYIHL